MKVKGEGEQRTFTVVAKGLSEENKYVKSVTLNGKKLDRFVITHDEILAGGELVFEMTEMPERSRCRCGAQVTLID